MGYYILRMQRYLLLAVVRRLTISQKINFSFMTSVFKKRYCCKILIVGGGPGGCSVAARFSKKLYRNEIIIVEPKDIHIYKPMFTLIGGGVKKLRDAIRPILKILPENVTWLKDSVKYFCPDTNTVTLKSDSVIEYEFMVLAVGIKVDYDEVCGLETALENYENVCTIYSSKFVEKTYKCLQEFTCGTALFTSPKTPISCLAAPQKICFIAEHYFRKRNTRHDAEIIFATAQRLLFPVKVFEDALWSVMHSRKVDVHLCTNLIEVIPDCKKAVFECLEKPGNKICLQYSMLHVTPPMSPPIELKGCKELVNRFKYADVNKRTLQHERYSNVYALGDCIASPLTKTASAIGIQSHVVFKNISNALNGKQPNEMYGGYTASPVITGYGTGILAEFDYTLNPVQTFPFREDLERKVFYFLKKEITPILYWNFLVKGLWNGPEFLTKFFHFNFSQLKNKNLYMSNKNKSI